MAMNDQGVLDSPKGTVGGSATVREPKSTAAFCLIVDDEKSLRGLIARALRQRMVMTEECGDAPSALRAIKHRTPDLIFLDISLERSDASSSTETGKVSAT